MDIPVATWTPADEPLAYEVIYEQLRRAVMRQELPGGSRLSESELAARLDVSRTPVREALRRLESDGLVVRGPLGLVVTETGPDDLGDIGLLRIEVDGLAARLAASRGTAADWEAVFERVERLRDAPDEKVLAREHRDLHRAIYAVGFSPRLAAVFAAHLLPYIEEAVNVGPGFGADPAGSYRQHLELVSVFASGDADAAEAASRAHARSGMTYAKAQTSPTPAAQPPAASSVEVVG
jgi:DNA-binding GntR family transcriptional regulator